MRQAACDSRARPASCARATEDAAHIVLQGMPHGGPVVVAVVCVLKSVYVIQGVVFQAVKAKNGGKKE